MPARARVAPVLPKPAQILASRFAGANRQQHDNNVAVVAKLGRTFGKRWKLQAAIARGTRSSYYLERYEYIPLQASAGLADGNNYVGTINLDPEVAYDADLNLDFTGERLSLSPEIYYHRIHNYITGVADGDPIVAKVSKVNGDAMPLRYANVNAEIYGADLAAAYDLTKAWTIRGGGSYTRGQRVETNDNLYRIAPARLRLAVVYDQAAWRLMARERYVFAQHHISRSHLSAGVGQPKTGGYALTDVSALYRANSNISLAFGIDNLLDRQYRDFMEGYNRVGDSAIPLGARLPGAGRNAYASLRVKF